MHDKPTTLGTAGNRLWDSITAEFDFTAEPGKIAILERACRVADRIESLEEAVQTEPMTAKGSMGQLVIHPFISEIRQQTTVFNSLVKSLGLPDSDEEAAEKAHRRKQQASRAAHARWGRGGGGQ